MESGFEDDFAPMQSSNGTADDPPLILGEEESPKKNSEGKNLDLNDLEIRFQFNFV